MHVFADMSHRRLSPASSLEAEGCGSGGGGGGFGDSASASVPIDGSALESNGVTVLRVRVDTAGHVVCSKSKQQIKICFCFFFFFFF